VTRHAELRRYTRELARETGDTEIFRAFREAG